MQIQALQVSASTEVQSTNTRFGRIVVMHNIKGTSVLLNHMTTVALTYHSASSKYVLNKLNLASAIRYDINKTVSQQSTPTEPVTKRGPPQNTRE